MRTLCFIDNQYDNDMKAVSWSDKTARLFLKMIKNPAVVDKKDKIQQWKFCSINGTRRKTENIGMTDILILDFDDPGYSIKEFEDSFREYFYILHTSHSYDGTNQKFRVFLFLNQEYEINRLFYKCHNQAFSPYHYLAKYFAHVDKASFVKCQFFKCPAIKYKGAPYYYNCHNGKLFDFTSVLGFEFKMAYDCCVEKQEAYVKKQQKQADWFRKVRGVTDLTKAKEYIMKRLETCEEGGRHMLVVSLAAWFKRIGGSFKEFEEMMPTWADKNFHKQLTHLSNEWERLH